MLWYPDKICSKRNGFGLEQQSLALAQVVLACEEAPGRALKADDGVGDLQVSLLFQVSQDSSSEEDFALTHPEQIMIQLQSTDLDVDSQKKTQKPSAQLS